MAVFMSSDQPTGDPEAEEAELGEGWGVRLRLTPCCSVADGSPMSWWLDRDGERRSYWGGFLPGVQQCSCSLEENCVDMNYFCNCDADRDAW